MLSGWKAKGDGRPGSACEQIHLREYCGRVWQAEPGAGEFPAFLDGGGRIEQRDAGVTRFCLDLSYIDEERWQHWCNEFKEISKMLRDLAKAISNSI